MQCNITDITCYLMWYFYFCTAPLHLVFIWDTEVFGAEHSISVIVCGIPDILWYHILYHSSICYETFHITNDTHNITDFAYHPRTYYFYCMDLYHLGLTEVLFVVEHSIWGIKTQEQFKQQLITAQTKAGALNSAIKKNGTTRVQ